MRPPTSRKPREKWGTPVIPASALGGAGEIVLAVGAVLLHHLVVVSQDQEWRGPLSNE